MDKSVYKVFLVAVLSLLVVSPVVSVAQEQVGESEGYLDIDELPKGNQSETYSGSVGNGNLGVTINGAPSSTFDVDVMAMDYGDVDLAVSVELDGGSEEFLDRVNAVNFVGYGMGEIVRVHVYELDGDVESEDETLEGEEPSGDSCGYAGEGSGSFGVDLSEANGVVDLDPEIAFLIGASNIKVNVNKAQGTIQVIHISGDGQDHNNEDLVFMDEDCNEVIIPYSEYGGNYNGNVGWDSLPTMIVTNPDYEENYDDEGVVGNDEDSVEEEGTEEGESIMDGMLSRNFISVGETVNITVEESLLGRSYYVNTSRYYNVEEIPELFELFQ